MCGRDQALKSCKDEVFQSPRKIPYPTQPEVVRQLRALDAKAGAPPVAEVSKRKGAREQGAGRQQWERDPTVPPPIWQKRPKKEVVVTREDMDRFQHFWLANEKYKLVMLAIPKVSTTVGESSNSLRSL